MEKLNVSAFEVYDTGWALLTSGSISDYNTMTISWGGLGTLWGRPVATVYVRHSRYTYEFLEKNDCFTISFFEGTCRDDLDVLGKLSGRDTDKVAKTSLTPIEVEGCVSFKEAKKTLVCRKLYADDLDPALMPEDIRESAYLGQAPHKMYIGEVLEII